MRFRSLTIMCALVLLVLGAATNVAQDKPSPSLTGRASPVNSSELKLELEGYNGKLVVESLYAPGTEVEEGEAIAQVSAPELEEAITELENSVEQAQRSLESQQASAAMADRRRELSIQSAERSLERAQESLDHFNKIARDERIRRSELSLESSEHSIQDQEEELAQLEELYEGNDLAKESQDIVLNRSKRRLKVSKERLEMQKRSHERLKSVEIPRRLEDLTHAVESAKLAHEAATNPNLNGTTEQELKMERAVESFESKQESLEKLKGDAERLTIKAPHAGFVVVGGMGGNDSVSRSIKVGDEVKKGQTLISVVDTGKLEVTVSIAPDAREKFQPGTAVQVTAESLDATADGKVEAVGFMVDKSGHVSARITIDNADGKLLPGVEVKVALGQ